MATGEKIYIGQRFVALSPDDNLRLEHVARYCKKILFIIKKLFWLNYPLIII